MFGIGVPEMLLILAIALIVIGPKKLPDLAKSLGRALGEFKKATSDIKESLEIETDLTDVKKAFDEMNQDIRETVSEGIQQAEAPTTAEPSSAMASAGDRETEDLSSVAEETSDRSRQDRPDESAAKNGAASSVDGGDVGDVGGTQGGPETSGSEGGAKGEQGGSARNG